VSSRLRPSGALHVCLRTNHDRLAGVHAEV
jgi:hypothetical protein